jgi:hypothetical protein
MRFSAFLGASMPKKREQPELRTVEEDFTADAMPLRIDPQRMRKGGGKAQEVEDVKIRLEARNRGDLKFRSYEPKLEELVEQDAESLENEWDEKRVETRLSKGWWILFGLMLVSGAGWAFFEIHQFKTQGEKIRVEKDRLLEREEQEERDARQTIASIRQVVLDFYGSATVDEMRKHVRHAERVGPLMDRYYSGKSPHPSEVLSLEQMNPLTIGSRGGFWLVLTKLEGGVEGKLVVEVKSPDDAKVDWEMHVCYQSMDWEEFVQERPPGFRGEFRVYAERDHFYNFEFSDSTKYQVYKLSALNSHEVVFGYALRDGQAFHEIEETLNRNNDQKVPVILRLYLQEGLQARSAVLIEEFVAPRWLLVVSPEVGE